MPDNNALKLTAPSEPGRRSLAQCSTPYVSVKYKMNRVAATPRKRAATIVLT